MHEIFTMMLAVYDRAALMLICLFFLIRLRLFRELLHKSAHTPKELLAVTAIFSLFALFSTWSGVPVEGSLVNVRIIAVMSGGILFGPWVGAIVGVIAGVHRYLIDIDGVTAVPCFITSIVAGLLSGLINRKVAREQRWKIGILAGMMCETLTMILVVVWAPSLSLGLDIVSKIGIPMILGSVCIGFIVLLVQSVEGEKEASAARQAKLALDIANKTLPLFRQVNSDSLRQVCDIIRRDITADAVAITNTETRAGLRGRRRSQLSTPRRCHQPHYPAGYSLWKNHHKKQRRSPPHAGDPLLDGHSAVGKRGGHRHA